MTLQEAKVGERIFVVAVNAPAAERKRLESLGITPGAEISVLADNGGPVLISVDEARLAVERELAAFVLVA